MFDVISQIKFLFLVIFFFSCFITNLSCHLALLKINLCFQCLHEKFIANLAKKMYDVLSNIIYNGLIIIKLIF